MLPKWQSHKVVEASKILGVVRDAERTVLKLLDGDDVAPWRADWLHGASSSFQSGDLTRDR